MNDNIFDEIREKVLQTADTHYNKDSPEHRAFIAGAGHVLSQHDMGEPTVAVNPSAFKQGKIVSEKVEVRHYTQDTEEEVAQWIVDKTQYRIGVAIVGETLYFGEQTAKYGDFIVYSDNNVFTVHKGHNLFSAQPDKY